jgi:MFS family permease
MNKEKTSSKNTSRFRSIARALSYRNFRLFFAGQSISLIGTWMQRIALGWLVYRMTNSAFLLGFVGFAGQLPTFLFSSFAGVLADRMNRHRLLIVTQTMAMIQALILALLVLMGSIAVWHIILLSILLGLINAIDNPVRQSFMVEMVGRKEDYGNAIALNSSMVNGARLIGPSVAGILIAAVGEGICFLINGISYLAVITALLAMRIARKTATHKRSHIWRDLKEGFAYAFGFAPIRAILLLLSLVSLMGMSYAVLMPIIARDILHGQANTLGFLMGAAGVGALIGALSLAARKSVLGLGNWIIRGAAALGVGLILTSLSRMVWLSIITLLLVGFGMMVQMASSNTLLQTIVDDDKRGRVMSFYAMAFMGMMPFGSLIAGSLASKIGAPNTLIIGGTCCLTGSAVFARKLPTLRKIVHPIYVKMGIIPEIATGIESATDLTLSQKRF